MRAYSITLHPASSSPAGPAGGRAGQGRATARSGHGPAAAVASRALPLLVLLALAAALAAMGSFLAVDSLAHRAAGRPAAQLPPGPFAVGQAIPTSFGAVRVEFVARADGVTKQQMGGMPMGQDHVAEDEVQVEPTVILTNGLGDPLALSPAQFRLVVDDRAPLELRGANIRPTLLAPGASIEAQLIFVAPRDGAQLWLEFADPGRPAPVRIDLGRTDQAPADAGGHDGHSHGP